MIAWPCRLITLQWTHRLAALSLNSTFPSSAYEAFFVLLHSHLSFPHLTAGEIVRSCRTYKISPKKCIAILSICIHSQGTQRKLQINYYSGDYLVLLSNWPGTHSIAFNWLKKIIRGVQQIYSNQISLITELKWNAVAIGGLHSHSLTRSTSILT